MTSVRDKLESAQKIVHIGEKYAHYKNPTKPYVVVNVALLEANEEPCVVYQSQAEDKLIWVRPISSFFEMIEYAGSRVSRFQKL